MLCKFCGQALTERTSTIRDESGDAHQFVGADTGLFCPTNHLRGFDNHYVATEGVMVTDLEEGDIVWTHGMRVKLGEKHSIPLEPDRGPLSEGAWFPGEILNGEHVPFDYIPKQFRGDDGKSWTIQSNGFFGVWAREVQA